MKILNGTSCKRCWYRSPILAELMERRKAARLVKTATGEVLAKYIFHCKGEPIGDFRKAWATACKLAGVSERLFHDLTQNRSQRNAKSRCARDHGAQNLWSQNRQHAAALQHP